MKVQDAISTLYKGYVLKGVMKDANKFVRRNLRNVEWDRDYWLHKIGMSPYQPVKSTVGGVGLFFLGAVAGGIAALALAPKRGVELRAQVKDRAMGLIGKAQQAPGFGTQPQA